MSLIRESLKKVQEDNQNDKSTVTLISGPKANGGKKVTILTVILIGIGVVLIAGPSKSAALGGASASKPVVVAQASSPAIPANPGPSPPLKEKLVEASVLGPEPTPAEKAGQGKKGLAELTVQLKKKTGPGLRPKQSARKIPAAARTRPGLRPKRSARKIPAAVRTGPGLKPKGSARKVPSAARRGAGEPQDRGGQEALKLSYQQAYSWQQEGKTEQAMNRYREILSQDPYNPYVLTNLGLIYQQIGNWKEAISLYEKAIESDPKFVPAAQNLGVAWLKAGNSEEAARWLERTLALQPDNANALVNLGILYKRRGNREMARQSLRKAWTLNNRLPEASYNLARLEEEAGNIPEAYKYYQQFIRTRNDPNDNLVREVQRHVQNWGIPEPVQK